MSYRNEAEFNHTGAGRLITSKPIQMVDMRPAPIRKRKPTLLRRLLNWLRK